MLWGRQGQKGGGPLGITLTIDGQRTRVPEGTTIFNAARELGITVPHLCYHPMLSVIGACRLCIVEVEGMTSLPASCSTPVKEGMVVATESAWWMPAGRSWIPSRQPPEDCLTCEKRGTAACRLRLSIRVQRSSFTRRRQTLRCRREQPLFHQGSQQVHPVRPVRLHVCGEGWGQRLHLRLPGL